MQRTNITRRLFWPALLVLAAGLFSAWAGPLETATVLLRGSEEVAARGKAAFQVDIDIPAMKKYDYGKIVVTLIQVGGNKTVAETTLKKDPWSKQRIFSASFSVDVAKLKFVHNECELLCRVKWVPDPGSNPIRPFEAESNHLTVKLKH